jgi:hypothetical protein
LKLIHERRMHQTLSSRDFKNLLEELSGQNFDDFFDYYFKSY